jgi:hypothetical protein
MADCTNNDAPSCGRKACWLCSYQSEPLGIKLNAFVVKHIGVMSIETISMQVSDFLLLNEPASEGAESLDVQEHVQRHMLHPRVRFAVLLRQLLDFAALLQKGLVVMEGGAVVVDKSNAELYFKSINQILTLYKADITGMLFSDDERGMIMNNNNNATEKTTVAIS